MSGARECAAAFSRALSLVSGPQRFAALRVSDVDFMRCVVSPAIQWPAEPLQSETSRTPIPIPQELALELSAAVERWQGVERKT